MYFVTVMLNHFTNIAFSVDFHTDRHLVGPRRCMFCTWTARAQNNICEPEKKKFFSWARAQNDICEPKMFFPCEPISKPCGSEPKIIFVSPGPFQRSVSLSPIPRQGPKTGNIYVLCFYPSKFMTVCCAIHIDVTTPGLWWAPESHVITSIQWWASTMK